VFWFLDANQSFKSPENVSRCSSGGYFRSVVVLYVWHAVDKFKEKGRENLYQLRCRICTKGPVDPFNPLRRKDERHRRCKSKSKCRK
jgi:hypothetical protein